MREWSWTSLQFLLAPHQVLATTTASTTEIGPTSGIIPGGSYEVEAVLIVITAALIIARVIYARRKKNEMEEGS